MHFIDDKPVRFARNLHSNACPVSCGSSLLACLLANSSDVLVEALGHGFYWENGNAIVAHSCVVSFLG